MEMDWANNWLDGYGLQCLLFRLFGIYKFTFIFLLRSYGGDDIFTSVLWVWWFWFLKFLWTFNETLCLRLFLTVINIIVNGSWIYGMTCVSKTWKKIVIEFIEFINWTEIESKYFHLMLNLFFIFKQYKNRLMLIALFWWAIPTLIAIFLLHGGIQLRIRQPEFQFDELSMLGIRWISLIYFASGFVAFYILCVLSFYFVKKHTQSRPLWDICYSKEMGGIQTGENNNDSVWMINSLLFIISE